MNDSVNNKNKTNPNAQALVVYKDTSYIYLYGEKVQLESIACKLDSQPFDLTMRYSTSSSWGPHLSFTSIASVYTLLLRNGFRLSHESKAHLQHEANYFIEIWIRD